MRVVFPAFEDRKLWIATKRNSTKARHIERDPKVELFWEAGNSRPVAHLTVSGTARFLDDSSEKARVWNAKLFGYNLREFWPQGPTSPDLGLLLVAPTRIELGWQPAMWRGEKPQVWKPPVAAPLSWLTSLARHRLYL